jgi:hypothetical protein
MDIVDAPARTPTSGHGTSGVIPAGVPLAVVAVPDANRDEKEFAGV